MPMPVRWDDHMMQWFLQTLDAGAELESDHPGFNVSQGIHWRPLNTYLTYTAP